MSRATVGDNVRGTVFPRFTNVRVVRDKFVIFFFLRIVWKIADIFRTGRKTCNFYKHFSHRKKPPSRVDSVRRKKHERRIYIYIKMIAFAIRNELFYQSHVTSRSRLLHSRLYFFGTLAMKSSIYFSVFYK